MATAAYYAWIRDGSPWRLARPVDDLAATLRQRGYTVGTIGNSAHLTASTPEDHTPFSATGWPGTSPYPRVLALDIMPPPAGSGLPDLVTLAERIIAARDAGRPEAAWIKYINWTDRQGRCWHTSWQPSRAQWSSSDTGHIHISGRTDYVDSACAAGWDPSEGDDMPLSPADLAAIKQTVNGGAGALTIDELQRWLGDGVDSRSGHDVDIAPRPSLKAILDKLNGIQAAGQPTQEQVDAAVRAALADPQIQQGIAAAIASHLKVV